MKINKFVFSQSSKIDVGHVAKLANLPLTAEEKKRFEIQLSSILDYFKKLEQVDLPAGKAGTKEVKPTSQVTGLENVTREDVVSPSLPQEEVLKNIKSKHNGMFKVKAILESD